MQSSVNRHFNENSNLPDLFIVMLYVRKIWDFPYKLLRFLTFESLILKLNYSDCGTLTECKVMEVNVRSRVGTTCHNRKPVVYLHLYKIANFLWFSVVLIHSPFSQLLSKHH